MNLMTPEEARDLLDGTTPGPWEVDTESTEEASIWAPSVIVIGPYYDREDAERWETGTPEDLRLAAAAPALAALAAGMRTEYRAEQQADGGTWLPICGWDSLDAAQFFAEHLGDGVTRIVRRYVTEPEEK